MGNVNEDEGDEEIGRRFRRGLLVAADAVNDETDTSGKDRRI